MFADLLRTKKYLRSLVCEDQFDDALELMEILRAMFPESNASCADIAAMIIGAIDYPRMYSNGQWGDVMCVFTSKLTEIMRRRKK
jgi:hypothetical protein